MMQIAKVTPSFATALPGGRADTDQLEKPVEPRLGDRLGRGGPTPSETSSAGEDDPPFFVSPPPMPFPRIFPGL